MTRTSAFGLVLITAFSLGLITASLAWSVLGQDYPHINTCPQGEWMVITPPNLP